MWVIRAKEHDRETEGPLNCNLAKTTVLSQAMMISPEEPDGSRWVKQSKNFLLIDNQQTGEISNNFVSCRQQKWM